MNSSSNSSLLRIEKDREHTGGDPDANLIGRVFLCIKHYTFLTFILFLKPYTSALAPGPLFSLHRITQSLKRNTCLCCPLLAVFISGDSSHTVRTP